MVNIDLVAIGAFVRIGEDIYRKVSPLICECVKNGQLLYDARLYNEFKNVEPPMVEYIGRKLVGHS